MTNKLTPEQALQIARDRFFDHKAFCANSLTIRDKQGMVVPLRLSPAQEKLAKALQGQIGKGKPIRACILKARQVHMSVGVASWLFKQVAFLPGQKALVFGDLHKSATNLFGYYRQFDESYNGRWSGLKKLERTRIIQDRKLEYEGGGMIDFGSADSTTTGRSYSIRHLHLSEYAFYRDAAELMTGVMQSIPQDPGTSVIVESTANGVGGPFYDLWQRATDPGRATDWIAIFFAWWEHPEYRRALEVSPQRFEGTLSREEQELKQAHKLTFEQIAWRRWAIENMCEGSVDRFHQEFPSTPEEAFLTSGRPRFDLISLGRMPVIRDPLAGELERMQVGTRTQVIFADREDGKGPLRVWKRPAQGHRYVIGADASKGIDVGVDMGRSDPDYTAFQVLDVDAGEQVAVFRERLAPHPSAIYLADLAEWYNWAFVVPEANELGLIESLLATGYPVHLIYQRQRTPDDWKPNQLHEIGFLTTTTTKPQLISRLDGALRERSVSIHDSLTLQELRTFVYTADGKQQGQPGCHDDLVMALALAITGLTQATIAWDRQQHQHSLDNRPVAIKPGRWGGRGYTRQNLPKWYH